MTKMRENGQQYPKMMEYVQKWWQYPKFMDISKNGEHVRSCYAMLVHFRACEGMPGHIRAR